MQSKHPYDATIIIDKNTASKADNNITYYNYKKRREELNAVVKNYIERQKQRTTQKNKSIAI